MDSITVAKFLSVPTAFFLSGYSFSFSQSTVPLVYNQPASVSTQVFKGVYYNGAAVVAPGALVSALGYAYLAYSVPEQRNLYATAGVITMGPLLFTRTVMNAGIQRLLKIGESAAEQGKADQTGEVANLLRSWVMQNWVRASLSLVAGMVGLYAWSIGAQRLKSRVE